MTTRTYVVTPRDGKDVWEVLRATLRYIAIDGQRLIGVFRVGRECCAVVVEDAV